MSEASAGAPESREQIAGLTFALLLLKPDLTIEQVNPAAESLIGRSARRLLGRKFLDVVSFAEGRISERLLGDEAQTVARGLAMQVDDRPLVVNMTISPMAAQPGWRVIPDSVEFWQARHDRRHVRLRYRRAAGSWMKELLWP